MTAQSFATLTSKQSRTSLKPGPAFLMDIEIDEKTRLGPFNKTANALAKAQEQLAPFSTMSLDKHPIEYIMYS